MNKKIYLYLILGLFYIVNPRNNGYAQANYGHIEGKVTNVNNEPIEGINVGLKGTSFGAATDQNGKYLIRNIEPGDYTLTVSGVGYKKKQIDITVEPGTTLAKNFELKEDTKEAPLNLALADARSAYPDAYRFSLSKPKDSTGVIRAYVQQLEGVYYKNASFQYDQYTGERLAERHHHDKNMGEKVITANYDIHVGAILGIPGKILAFIASLISASLPVTGFMIWWGRRKKKEAKPKRTKHSFRDDQKLKRNGSMQLKKTG